jgi:ERCC4-type nuclease
MTRQESECFPVPPPNLPLRVRQNGKTIRIPKPTIVIDSQEHMGYKFERFTNWFSGTIRKRLPVGDYTLQGMEEEVIVERKTIPDLVNSIIQDREVLESAKNFLTSEKVPGH